MCQLDNKDGQGFLLFWFVVGCADPSSLVNVSRSNVGSRAGALASGGRCLVLPRTRAFAVSSVARGLSAAEIFYC